MDSAVNYHAEIQFKRGKVFLKPTTGPDLTALKKLNFRLGGLLFADTCKALKRRVLFEIKPETLSKLDPFAFLMGDVGIAAQPRGSGRPAKVAKKASLLKAKKVVRVCVDIQCRCRGYNCKCTGRVHPC